MHAILKQLLITLSIIFFITACGSESRPDDISDIPKDSNAPIATSFGEDEKDFLYNLFLTEYYWNDNTPNPFDYSNYSEPQTMIDALKYSAKDRWSFVLTQQEYNDFASQSTAGFGFQITFDNSGYMVIYIVDIDSPADHAGFLRGDKIVKINGETATVSGIQQAYSAVNQSTSFVVNRDGEEIELNIASQTYTFKVTKAKSLTTEDGQKVGYLRFDSFTDNATEEIDQAFTYLKSLNINKLVIDLRYNGGGYINTASILLDKLVRDKDEQIQFTLKWNDGFSANNESGRFETDSNSLALKQIVFLTTQDSASASELVINSLMPEVYGVDVVLVGDRTHGKPVGMQGRSYGDHIYFIINFVTENIDGFSDYFDGIPADCTVDDDLSHQLGDPQEAMLKKALYYIDNGSC